MLCSNLNLRNSTSEQLFTATIFFTSCSLLVTGLHWSSTTLCWHSDHVARQAADGTRPHWLLPINCHFRDCEARCSGSPCKLRYIKIRPLPLPLLHPCLLRIFCFPFSVLYLLFPYCFSNLLIPSSRFLVCKGLLTFHICAVLFPSLCQV